MKINNKNNVDNSKLALTGLQSYIADINQNKHSFNGLLPRTTWLSWHQKG